MRQCEIPGCDRIHYATGLCRMHYQRKAKYGDAETILVVRNAGTKCSVTGCASESHSRGLCRIHYVRWQRHGDPNTTLVAHKHQVPPYTAMHSRVNRARGKASAHLCTCGARADEWAYDHVDPNQVVDKGRPYSVDVMHYAPRCRSCHRKEDLAR